MRWLCAQFNELVRQFNKLVRCIGSRIYGTLRKVDDWVHDGYRPGSYRRWLWVKGYSLMAVLTVALALGAMLFKPARPAFENLLLIVTLIMAAVMVAWLARQKATLVPLIAVVVTAGVGILWNRNPWSTDLTATQLFLCLWGALAVMQGLAFLYLKGFPLLRSEACDDLRHWLKEVDLCAGDQSELRELPVGIGIKIWATMSVAAENLLRLLIVPALAVLLLRLGVFGASVALVLWWGVLALAALYPRLDMLLQFIRRMFLVGVQLVVSLTVIVLAIMSLVPVEQVVILLDSAGTRLVAWLVFAAYATAWFHEFWINRFLMDHLLTLMGETDPERPGELRPVGAGDTGVIRIHGVDRFKVFRKDDPGSDDYLLYRKQALFERIINYRGRADEQLQCHDLADTEQKADACASAHRRQKCLQKLTSGIQLYFLVLNLGLLLCAGGVVWYLQNRVPQQPQVVAESGRGAPVALAHLLRSGDRPFIAVAASGGGTRAALYTASLLYGLKRAGLLQDVKLLSGVSGGSAAIAYFAAHREGLQAAESSESASTGMKTDRTSAPSGCTVVDGRWQDYCRTLIHPFIQDVLASALEARVALGSVRLGNLLVESFNRAGLAGTEGLARPLGDVDDIGLIFNTTLVGKLDCRDCQNEVRDRDEPHWFPFARAALQKKDRTQTRLAGNRLLLTNLAGSESLWPGPGEGEGEADGFVAIADPAIPLSNAAAVSANFPPVFPNAAIDVDARIRYWVTDGGAVDNRGLVSLLQALLSALGEPGRADFVNGPPPIHVIVADASLVKAPFSQWRGIKGALAGAGKNAALLEDRLWADVVRRYRALGGKPKDIRLHRLGMPEVLRRRGGIETHWMLPAEIDLDQEVPPLPRAEIPALLFCLHTAPDDPGCKRWKQDRAAFWTRVTGDDKDGNYRQSWQRLLAALNPDAGSARSGDTFSP